MDPYANMGCVLRVNANCKACKMKVMDVLSSICGIYNVTIDAQTGLADISGQVEPNTLLYALARSGHHAELVRFKLQHPAMSVASPMPMSMRVYDYDYGYSTLGMTPSSYPIHDPYWYERNVSGPAAFGSRGSHPAWYSTSEYAYGSPFRGRRVGGCNHCRSYYL